MIRLQDVSISFSADGRVRNVLDNVSLTLPSGGTIGILAHRGEGKTTLINLLAQQIQPTSGYLILGGSVSWVMSSIRPLLGVATVRNNIRFAAMVYRVAPQELMRQVAALGDLHDLMDFKLNELPRPLQVRLAYSMCLCLGFDYYLADETMVIGDNDFKERMMHYLQSTAHRRTMILATRSPAIIRRYCDQAYVLHAGRLHAANTPGDAIRMFKMLKNDGQPRQSKVLQEDNSG